MNPIRIAAKTLGAMALDDFCPRCFYLRLRSGNRMPYQLPFPGVFSAIDSYGKWLVADHYARSGTLPPWLAPIPQLVRPVKVPHVSRFRWLDEESGIELAGVPDHIFLCAGGGHYIIDDKTAAFTAAQDRLLPMYMVQLNSYAQIAAQCGFGPVRGIALCYFQPQTSPDARASLSAGQMIRGNGFAMSFAAKLLELPLQPQTLLPPLLRRARELLDGPCPAATESCQSCRRARYIEQITELEDSAR